MSHADAGSQGQGDVGAARIWGARAGTPPAPAAFPGAADTLAFSPKLRDCIKPFNIASYALLTHMLAQQAGLEVGEFIWTGGDCHLYLNHLDQAREQLGRTPGALPRLEIRRKAASIDSYALEDFVLHDYHPQAHIKAPVAV